VVINMEAIVKILVGVLAVLLLLSGLAILLGAVGLWQLAWGLTLVALGGFVGFKLVQGERRAA